MIYRVLTLVILLDRIPAKMQLPQQAPFLFRLGSECKSSEAVLMEVLHASLSGVGKLSKHLGKMHYEVSFKQRDVDEWPMSVSSLGTDLSNGIILCKLVTLLLGQVCFCTDTRGSNVAFFFISDALLFPESHIVTFTVVFGRTNACVVVGVLVTQRGTARDVFCTTRAPIRW